MKKVKIKELFDIRKGKKAEEVESSDLRYIQIEDLRDNENIKFCSSSDSNVLCNQEDILIAWDGANAGTVGFGIEGVIGSTIARLRPKSDDFISDYVGLLLQSKFDFFQRTATGATIPHVSRKALENLEIPLLNLSVQKAIVAKLDRAQRLIDIDKEMLAKYDELIQSVFLEMFGDPVTNPKGWKVGSLTDYGSLKNGLNYSSNETGTKIRSLGVGDFGVLSKIDDIREISRIELDEAPPKNYLLKDNDLVFVRSNGNKELVGRCLVIYPGNEDVTFSGFCIRYRPTSSSINSTYLSHLFRVKSFRNYMLKDGRGANIQNINQKLLSQLDIPLPDFSKQNQFVKNVEKLEGQILKTQTSRKKSEELFSSLVQGAFG
ncbi:restriction endonuclease subunit S [Gracilimonas sp.]|uniref:restriction endonuclease subunit S n=1 Tax=Gracilimonas sp. TaxID=1974203 RepID=UPI003D105034